MTFSCSDMLAIFAVEEAKILNKRRAVTWHTHRATRSANCVTQLFQRMFVEIPDFRVDTRFPAERCPANAMDANSSVVFSGLLKRRTVRIRMPQRRSESAGSPVSRNLPPTRLKRHRTEPLVPAVYSASASTTQSLSAFAAFLYPRPRAVGLHPSTYAS